MRDAGQQLAERRQLLPLRQLARELLLELLGGAALRNVPDGDDHALRRLALEEIFPYCFHLAPGTISVSHTVLRRAEEVFLARRLREEPRSVRQVVGMY